MYLEGLQLGHYKTLKFLKKGGMGEIYQGEDLRISREVAIKLVRREASSRTDPEVQKEIERARREIQAITKLNHPHILHLYDFGEQRLNGDILTYMVMPYHSDGSLEDWLHQRDHTSLAPDDVAYLLDQAADALQCAHDHHIVHQDVKPSNFLISNKTSLLGSPLPNLHLADFGIARFTTATTSSSQNVGTPAYMPPEQWEATAQPTAANDQYALAIMAYQLLTGQLPFTGTVVQLMRQHANVVPKPPSELNKQLSPAIDAVILRALEKEPERRYSSIIAFAQAFRNALNENIDIQARVTIDSEQARQGTICNIILPSGESVTVRIPPHTQDGEVLIFEGQQVPYFRGGPRSRLIVPVSVLQRKVLGNNISSPLSSSPQQSFEEEKKSPPRLFYSEAIPRSSRIGCGWFWGIVQEVGRWILALFGKIAHFLSPNYLQREVKKEIGPSPLRSENTPTPEKDEPIWSIGQVLGWLRKDIEQQASLWTRNSMPPLDVTPSFRLSDGSATVPFTESNVSQGDLEDFIISYSRTDLSWAKWIKAQLDKAGYSTMLPPYCLRKGDNFEQEIQKLAGRAKCVVVILSPAYLYILSAQPDWIDTLRHNATDKKKVLLVCTQECYQEFGEIETVDYADISGEEDEAIAGAILLAAVRDEGVELLGHTIFPRSVINTLPPFPNQSLPESKLPTDKDIQNDTSGTSTNIEALRESLKQQIRVAFDNKDWDDVCRKVAYLAKRFPDTISYEIYYMQYQAFLEDGDKQEAYKALEDALTLIGDRSQRLVLLEQKAILLASLGDWPQVLRTTKEALKLSPDDVGWLKWREQALNQLKDHHTQEISTRSIGSDLVFTSEREERKTEFRQNQKRIEIFISYSHRDRRLKEELYECMSALRRPGRILVWHDREISPGTLWSQEIDKHLGTASIILLLISPSFIHSEYCYIDEMSRALERHEKKEAYVIPILLRQTDLVDTPLERLQYIPKDGRPVASWSTRPKRDEVFHDAVKEIRRVIDKMVVNAPVSEL